MSGDCSNIVALHLHGAQINQFPKSRRDWSAQLIVSEIPGMVQTKTNILYLNHCFSEKVNNSQIFQVCIISQRGGDGAIQSIKSEIAEWK